MRFGTQVHAEGVNPDTEHAEKTIRYITKYLTKDAASCHELATERQRAHLERLWAELRVTPCSERCANWLLYGIAPKTAHGKLKPGQCRSRVHQRATLGLGGRRILISREWSGKTLTDHRADARAWVRALLGVTETEHQDQDHEGEEQVPQRHAWEMARPEDPDVDPLPQRLLRAVSERIQWRNQLREAQERTGSCPPGDLSATNDKQPHHGRSNHMDKILTVEEAAQRIKMSARYVSRPWPNAASPSQSRSQRTDQGIRPGRPRGAGRVEPMTVSEVWRGIGA